MVERITGPTPPVRLPHGVGRHPDGDRVPHQPRAVRPASERLLPELTRRDYITGAVIAVIVLVLMVARIAGVLR